MDRTSCPLQLLYNLVYLHVYTQQMVGHPIPMPFVRPVLICKAMGICLIFKQIPIALQNKTSLPIGIGDRVSHPLYNIQYNYSLTSDISSHGTYLVWHARLILP